MRQHEEPNQIRPGMTIREEHYRGRHQLERPHNYHRRDVFIMAVIVNGKKVAGLGQPGKDGAPGADGKDGAPGKSAYQAAKEKGYTGTEEEFNTALAGMQSAPFLPLSGGTVEGVLEIRSGIEFGYGSNSIELSPSSASRLELVANASGGSSGGSIGGTVELIGLSAPTASNSAANKQYVDEHAGARVVTGTYVGTNENALNINFPFRPLSVFIFQLNYVGDIDEYFSVVAPESDSLYFFDGSRGSRLIVSWSGNRLTIYTTNGTFNRTNAKYKYIAFG